MKNCVITISREYGSGGRDVGRMIAEHLQLPVYDKEIMHLAAEQSGMPASLVEKKSESIPSKFLLSLKRFSLTVPSTRIPSRYNSFIVATDKTKILDEDRLFHIQSAVIQDLASQGGCVIIGRCASHILRNHPNLLSVFIRGNFQDRVQRTVQTYNMPEKNAAENVRKIDKHRANHYKLHTSQQWGAAKNYDLVINTSYAGIEGAARVIEAMVSAK
ncbi:MAG: cytidylate kinase-like family protein [Defluviitaleaceae bacterium]|nr:cytidylate kinase-like family protein [Defluviitaleaceae bacterium]